MVIININIHITNVQTSTIITYLYKHSNNTYRDILFSRRGPFTLSDDEAEMMRQFLHCRNIFIPVLRVNIFGKKEDAISITKYQSLGIKLKQLFIY
jgi:hypothetical protein